MKNLLNKAKPSYREIRPMRGRLMRGPPVPETEYPASEFDFEVVDTHKAKVKI